MGQKKKAVFFDFGDTLASTQPSYLTRIAMAMREAGYSVSDLEFERAYIKADYELYKMYKVHGKISPEEYKEWFFPILCSYLSITDNPQSVRIKTREALREIKFKRATLPGAIELLESLKERGFRLVVISNNDGKTEEKCEEVGIRHYFDLVADSTKLGLIKPDSRIFLFVLSKLNIYPEEAIHIGDLYGSDVMGGLNAGLEVIWFNQRQIDEPNSKNITMVKNLTEIKNIITRPT